MTTNQATTQGTKGAKTTYQGGCHCGAVRYEVDLDLSAGVTRCNCSICQKLSPTGALVKPTDFRLQKGEDHLQEYVFGTRSGQRYFCKTCGVHSFGKGHLEMLGGDYVSISVNCLDGVELVDLEVGYFDGRHDNWMAGLRPEPWRIG